MTILRVFGPQGRREAAQFLLPRMVLVAVFTTLLIYTLALLPGVPYHVHGLFGPSPSLPQAALFAVIVLFALAPPAYLGLELIRLPATAVLLFPVGILIHAVLVFLGFRFATPIASVQDLLGVPVWGIGDEWERMVRFVALFVGISVPFAGGSALLYALTRSYAPRRLLWWLLFAGLLLGASYQIVVIHAATDNVSALLAEGSPITGMAGLALWLVMLSFVGAVLAARLADVLRNSAATAFAMTLALPLSYVLITVSTGQSLGGARSTLSATAFLLSADLGEYQFTSTGLFLRYAAAYAVVVLLLACSQYPLWIIYATRRFQARPARVIAASAEESGGRGLG